MSSIYNGGKWGKLLKLGKHGIMLYAESLHVPYIVITS